MRTIGVVSAGRSDYGIYRPVLDALVKQPLVRVDLYVTGTHLVRQFGLTVGEIERDGHRVAARVPMPVRSDDPRGIAEAIAVGTRGFARVFAERDPDIVVLLGDRFEMHAAAVASLPFALPVAHIHGGESTQGLFDELIRHSITKLSHLHFVSMSTYRDRLLRMGEEPWRVIVSGAPALDNIRHLTLPIPADFSLRLGIPMDPAPLVVTYHPVTLESERTATHIGELLAALTTISDRAIVITYPNTDTRSQTIIAAIDEFALSHRSAHVIKNLGTADYFGLLARAGAMVGNSSSGIIEAPSFHLPVVNVGRRQEGRVRAANVIDVPEERGAIARAIRRALSPAFRARLRRSRNPYGDGRAGARIARRLAEVELGDRLIHKKFFDG